MASNIEVTEAPLVRVPFDSLKRAAKDRKALIDELAEVVSALQGQKQQQSASTGSKSQANGHSADGDGDNPMTDVQPAGCDGEAAGPGPSSHQAHIEALSQLFSQLQGLKRKLTEVSKTERDDCQRCKARLEHLAATGTPAKDCVLPWTKARLDRILVDHLLRYGHYDTAQQLVKSANLSLLTDCHIFMEARKVVEALKAHDASTALAWCDDNRARLRKTKSKLEFKLHLQQFIELVRQDQRLVAIAYARANLAQWAGQYMPELQRAVATLAFTPKTRCPLYRALFDDAQWDGLVDLFLKDLYKLHSLTPESLLYVYLQAGLSALKTPASVAPADADAEASAEGADGAGCSGSSGREDPLRLPAFQALSKGLPFAKHVHSKLLCAITKELMSDDNPPVVLPNGYVYSQKGAALVMARNGGQMRCPRTGAVFGPEELRRAYIV